METTEKNIDILNDLIQINNDRVAGFEKAIADIKEENFDLKELFREYASQSRQYSQELSALAARNGNPETGTSVSGSLHRAWIDVKSIFGASDRESILSEAERGEDAIRKAYSDALSDGGLSREAQQTVSSQATAINAAHDRIKALRDASKN